MNIWALLYCTLFCAALTIDCMGYSGYSLDPSLYMSVNLQFSIEFAIMSYFNDRLVDVSLTNRLAMHMAFNAFKLN